MKRFFYLIAFLLVAGVSQAATIADGASVEANNGAATDKTQRVTEANDSDLTNMAKQLTGTAGALEASTMLDSGAKVTPKFAVIDDAVSGDNTIVAAVGGKKIRVLAVLLVAAGDVDARFESGAGGTALTGQMDLTTNSGFSSGFSPVGHFETAVGALLNLELSAAVSVDGWIVYVEVD